MFNPYPNTIFIPWVRPTDFTTIPLQVNLRPNNLPANNQEAYCKFDIDWWKNVPLQNVNDPPVGFTFDLTLGTPKSLDHVRCLVVDNTYCPSELHIQFDDGFTVHIDPGEGLQVIPCLSTSLKFKVWLESNNAIQVNGVPVGFIHDANSIIYTCNANIPPLNNAGKKVQNSISGELNFAAVDAGTFTIFQAGDGTASSANALITPWVMIKSFTASAFLNGNAAAAINTAAVVISNIIVDNVVVKPLDTKSIAIMNNGPGVVQAFTMAPLLHNLTDMNVRANIVEISLNSNTSKSSLSGYRLSWNLVYEDFQGYPSI